MLYPKIPLAQTVIQLCKAKNIKHIVISPGSRNAPLTLGFTHDDYFSCYSIVDERCAAFFALGIAQQIQKPVAVVCTSGSALLNYYPAVAEAYFSNIPLVVLSADRPKHLVGIGDGQTINQRNVFKNHILYSANLKLDFDEKLVINSENKPEVQQENEIEINKALNKAILNNGPVHLNIPFNEPLYKITEKEIDEVKNIDVLKSDYKIDDDVLDECVSDWNNAEKKMILVGVNQPNEVDQKWLDELAKDNSILVFTETTSNLHHEAFFPCIDKLIAPLTDLDFKNLQPDILLTFGGLIVSKKIKAFLRTYQPKSHWHIGEHKANDTFFCLEKRLKIQPNTFFEKFLPKTVKSIEGDYKPDWEKVRLKRTKKHDDYLRNLPFCDFTVFYTLLKNIPNNSVLQLGNSSTIRYTQLFDLNKSLQVFCNRGTSGIDGSTSTAIGFSVTSKKQTTLITGDLSFFYDSNALWNNYIPNNFRIIIINNQGGGIFRILPGNKNTENFDRYFETKHDLNAKQLCAMYDLEYQASANEDQLKTHLQIFFNDSKSPKVLEVFTPRTINDEVLLEYFNFIK